MYYSETGEGLILTSKIEEGFTDVEFELGLEG